MRIVLALLGSVIFITQLGSAQSDRVQEVDLCQLRQHASEFDHKVVHVRGTVTLEFEDFTLYDSQCADSNWTSLWLTFGGDVSDIAVYCCGSHSRTPGGDLRIDGKPIPFTKDSQFEQFTKLLRAKRLRMPNGEPCYSACNFYRVSATLTGLFLAEKNTGTEHIGYGHLDCCSLLIIQKVADVSAQRTPVPIGVFSCEKSNWLPSIKDVPELESYASCNSSCDDEARTAIGRVAAHWNDNIIVSRGRTDRFGESTGDVPVEHLNWTSDDLLTSYAIIAERRAPPRFSATREICRRPPTEVGVLEPISCEEHSIREWDMGHQRKYEQLIAKHHTSAAEKMLARWAEKQSPSGSQLWRNKPLSAAAYEVLQREIQNWGIAADPNLRGSECNNPESLEGQSYAFASCSWYSRDGMQQFDINLLVKKSSQGLPRSPWLLNGASARICHFDASLTTANVRPEN